MSLPNCNYNKMLPKKNDLWNTSDCSADEHPEVPQEVRKSTTCILFFISVFISQLGGDDSRKNGELTDGFSLL